MIYYTKNKPDVLLFPTENRIECIIQVWFENTCHRQRNKSNKLENSKNCHIGNLAGHLIKLEVSNIYMTEKHMILTHQDNIKTIFFLSLFKCKIFSALEAIRDILH